MASWNSLPVTSTFESVSDLQINVTTLKNIIVGGGGGMSFNCTALNISQRFDNVHFWKVHCQTVIFISHRL